MNLNRSTSPQPAPSPFSELTQDQRLIRAKQDARSDDVLNLLYRRDALARERRFTDNAPSAFGSL